MGVSVFHLLISPQQSLPCPSLQRPENCRSVTILERLLQVAYLPLPLLHRWLRLVPLGYPIVPSTICRSPGPSHIAAPLLSSHIRSPLVPVSCTFFFGDRHCQICTPSCTSYFYSSVTPPQ